jgi:hypothetical protein
MMLIKELNMRLILFLFLWGGCKPTSKSFELDPLRTIQRTPLEAKELSLNVDLVAGPWGPEVVGQASLGTDRIEVKACADQTCWRGNAYSFPIRANWPQGATEITLTPCTRTPLKEACGPETKRSVPPVYLTSLQQSLVQDFYTQIEKLIPMATTLVQAAQTYHRLTESLSSQDQKLCISSQHTFLTSVSAFVTPEYLTALMLLYSSEGASLKSFTFLSDAPTWNSSKEALSQPFWTPPKLPSSCIIQNLIFDPWQKALNAFHPVSAQLNVIINTDASAS